MFLISDQLLRILTYNRLKIILSLYHLDHNHHVLLKAWYFCYDKDFFLLLLYFFVFLHVL